MLQIDQKEMCEPFSLQTSVGIYIEHGNVLINMSESMNEENRFIILVNKYERKNIEEEEEDEKEYLWSLIRIRNKIMNRIGFHRKKVPFVHIDNVLMDGPLQDFIIQFRRELGLSTTALHTTICNKNTSSRGRV